jgi:hypothetical protein
MGSEEFKVMLVVVLGVSLLFSQALIQRLSYESGFNAGKISVLAPEKVNKE